MIRRLIDTLFARLAHLTWATFGTLVAIHAAVTWVGLSLAGEAELTRPVATFVYFYTTTASTVGYGDLSPVTAAGRLFAAVWLFPGALAAYTVFLGKLAQVGLGQWRARMEGLADYSHLRGATVLIGYNPVRTARMLREIAAGQSDATELVLVAARDVAVDMGKVRYVRAESLSSRSDLVRASVPHAANVVVYGESDEVTFSAAMAAAALNPEAHLVAYFEEEERAEILRAHTRAECVINQAAEIVVREMQDPGVADVFTDLSSARSNVAVFSLAAPEGVAAGAARAAFHRLGATFLGAKAPASDTPRFNLGDDADLAGLVLFYVAERRIGAAEFAGALEGRDGS